MYSLKTLNKFADTSHELVVGKWLNGVKILTPENESIFGGLAKNKIGNLFNLPAHVFFTLHDGKIFNLNESTAENCGFASRLSAIGRTIADVAKNESVEFEKKHDEEVMQNRHLVIKDELFQRNDGGSISAISFKLPWYNDQNTIIGVFGCAIILNKTSLANTINSIINTNLFNHIGNLNFIPGKEVCSQYLTKRESHCAYLLIRGKTGKEIANALKLSKRTIEHYIQEMKYKFNVNTKSELIEKLLSIF